MPSSTSGSNSAALFNAKALLAICAFLVLALEISSDYLLKHDSPTYARISRQYEQALTVRPAEAGEPTTVLMVGNSLLLHGVRLDRLQEMTSSRMHVYPIFLEQTGYYDWLYALRRLFREGAKPDVVVLGIGVNYFLENGIRLDYTPKLFFDARDILPVASDLRLDRTATSNLLLAHSSTYWDTRGAIRAQVLNHVVPHLPDLFSLINPRPAVPERREMEAISIPRLQRLQRQCEEHGVKLILLLPPTLSSENAIAEMALAARMAGVDVSVPIDPAGLSPKFYQRDGMHLNSEGAILFTSELAKDLPERVANRNAQASRSQIRAAIRVPPPTGVLDDENTSSSTDLDF